jgi:hypothetical protein
MTDTVVIVITSDAIIADTVIDVVVITKRAS